MIPSEEINKFKILIGQFHEEIKSNSITDLIIWLDCKLELQRRRETKIKELRRK